MARGRRGDRLRSVSGSGDAATASDPPAALHQGRRPCLRDRRARARAASSRSPRKRPSSVLSGWRSSRTRPAMSGTGASLSFAGEAHDSRGARAASPPTTWRSGPALFSLRPSQASLAGLKPSRAGRRACPLTRADPPAGLRRPCPDRSTRGAQRRRARTAPCADGRSGRSAARASSMMDRTASAASVSHRASLSPRRYRLLGIRLLAHQGVGSPQPTARAARSPGLSDAHGARDPCPCPRRPCTRPGAAPCRRSRR